MNLPVLLLAIYGIFCLAGGMIGYVKAKSIVSLVTGSIAGVVLLFSAYGTAKGVQAASWASLITSILLGSRFLGTWLKNRRVMPDLLIILLSLVTLVVIGLKLARGV